MDRDELQGDMNDLIIGSKEEQWSARLRIVAEFDRLTEETEKLEFVAESLVTEWKRAAKREGEPEAKAEALERICEPLKKFSTEELRRHNPYLPHDDAEHGTLWTIIERICDYLDSQGKDSQQKPTNCPTEGTFRCAHCGKKLDCTRDGDWIKVPQHEQHHLLGKCKPKDEEVLRGIFKDYFMESDTRTLEPWWSEKLLLHILEHFQLKEDVPPDISL